MFKPFPKTQITILTLTISTSFAAVNLAQADNKNATLAAENFQQADFDQNGVLQYAEFATFIDLNASDGLGKASLISNRGLYGRAFSRIDANNDGFVSPNELKSIMN